MSFNKFGEKSPYQYKSEAHMESWQDDIDDALGKSSKELGIFNREEVENRLKTVYEAISGLPELEFINDLKKSHEDAGIFLVGGSVRDAVIEKGAKDIDLIANKIGPSELVGILMKHGKVTFDRNPNANLKEMSEKQIEEIIRDHYGVLKFKSDKHELDELIDIAFPREDDYSNSGESGIQGIKRDTQSVADPNLNILDDLKRRDLTVNSMAINLVNGDIIDNFDGIEDIIKGEIRAVGDPTERILKEDFSRGFRAIRFACAMDGKIEDGTKKAIREIFKPAEKSAAEIYSGDGDIAKKVLEYKKIVREVFDIPSGNMPRCLQAFWDKEQEKPRTAVAAEVMCKEILKSISANPRKFVELIDEVGGLKVIFPELYRLKNLAQPREHHSEGDAFKHTLMLLDNLPKNATLRLKLAGLFHDLGKADTQEVDKEGKITFHGHAKNSVSCFGLIARRLKLTKKLSSEVAWLIDHHMLPLMVDANEIKPKKIEDYFLKNEDLGRELILLAEADALASIPEKGEPDLENINELVGKIEELEKRFDKQKYVEIPKIITGHDLIKLGLKPGKEFSVILHKVREAQLDGRIKSREDGLKLVGEIVSKKA